MKSYFTELLLQIPSASIVSTVRVSFNKNITSTVDHYEPQDKKVTLHLNKSVNNEVLMDI